ncbi:MAG: methyltransferase domain-containing protein [Solirubrobacteraceae bacterium]
MITGERVTVPDGGFNPTFQRHVAAYRLIAPLLGDGLVLDLGCGTGHSYRELAPRVTIGVDLEASVLSGQERETHVADMRSLPFSGASFASVIAVQSLEHVPDPESVLAEVVRVLRPGGRAVFVTPNRLTFGRPDEIIDPYHYLEYSSEELRSLCGRFFERVEVLGLHGSARYQSIVEAEHHELDRLLALDPLRLRRWVPRRLRQRLYDWRLRRDRAQPRATALEIGPEDFRLSGEELEAALDVIAICDLPAM